MERTGSWMRTALVLGMSFAAACAASPTRGTSLNDVGARLDAFWKWWQAAAPRLAATIDAGKSESIADEVGARVSEIDPHLSWETGPGRKGARHHLSLSPQGENELRV